MPSTRKVTKTEFDCECEEFCVPGPSLRTVCHDDCGKKKIIYTPTCAEVRTRKKLVKKETSTTVPTTKWVVENLCPKCATEKNSEPAPKDGIPKDPMTLDRAASPDYGAPVAAAGDVDAPEENARANSFASRLRSDLARVLLPAGRQK